MKSLFSCVSLLTMAIHLTAETVTLTPSIDTSIISTGINPRGDKTIVSGTRNNSALDRGLLKFDVSGVPQNATITSARLTMRVEMIPSGPVNSDFELFRSLKEWDATATWTAAKTGSAWSAPGGQAGADYASTRSAATPVQGLGNYEFASDGLVADVSAWVAEPASNFGWFLISANEAANKTARHFSSSESTQPPQLVIEFSTGAQAPTLSDVALREGKLSFRLNPSGKNVRVESSLSAAPGSWSAAADAVTATIPAGVEVTVPASGAHRFFRVALE